LPAIVSWWSVKGVARLWDWLLGCWRLGFITCWGVLGWHLQLICRHIWTLFQFSFQCWLKLPFLICAGLRTQEETSNGGSCRWPCSEPPPQRQGAHWRFTLCPPQWACRRLHQVCTHFFPLPLQVYIYVVTGIISANTTF
jgi:hypothetical protein